MTGTIRLVMPNVAGGWTSPKKIHSQVEVAMIKKLWALLAVVVGLTMAGAEARGQTNNYFGTSGVLSGNTWSTNPAGPYTSPLNTTNGAIINFENAATFTGGSIAVAGINATATATNTAPAGTISNFNNTVISINISNGATLDFGSQNFTASATAGYSKNGLGVVALAGGTYGGGFTLNDGTVIVRGVNAFGSTATNVLTLNGGILASNANRDLTGKYGGGIVIGGNIQFGDTTGLASSAANLTFTNNMSLGSTSRTFTLGNGGVTTFGGVIANSVAAGNDAITFAATSGGTGRFDITNTANTFTGNIRFTGGEVRFTANGSLGSANNSIIIDGGRFATLSAATYTLATTHSIFIGDTAGTSISTTVSGILTYDGVIADISGKTGTWAKQGAGTLALGGVSTYTGSTAINGGTLQLTTGSNRLPTGTTVSLGQTASTNLGTLDLNGNNQTIAGLNSTTGTNATASNNTVTSAAAATLTISGAGTYSYGAGTDVNSGVLTGALAVVKNGSGTQTFGDANTYSGGTTINAGTLLVTNTTGSGTGSGAVIVSGGTFGGTGIVSGSVTVQSGGTIRGDSGTGTGNLTVGNTTIQSGGAIAANIGATGTDSTLLLGANTLNLLTGSALRPTGVTGFSPTATGTYTIASLTSGSTLQLDGAGVADNFVFGAYVEGTGATGAVTIDTSALGFTLGTGDTFTLSRSGNDLVLVFAPVPEPASILAVAGLVMATGVRLRRRQRVARSQTATT